MLVGVILNVSSQDALELDARATRPEHDDSILPEFTGFGGLVTRIFTQA